MVTHVMSDGTKRKSIEGYKIAALVLNRLGKTFTIYNNEKNEVWESRFKNSEKWLEKILCFYVSKRKTDDHGLCIEVGNVTQGEFNDLYKVWLHLDDSDPTEKVKPARTCAAFTS